MEESNTKIYVADRGEGNHRRSLYTFWKRAAPPPSMETFNAPTREQCAVDRERTNTPLQALVTLNDVQFVEASRRLAEVAIVERGDDAGRLDAMALRVLSRRLATAEQEALKPVVRDLRAHYAADAQGLEGARRRRRLGSERVDPRRRTGGVDHGGEPVLQSRRGAQQVIPKNTFRVLLRRRRSGDDPTRAPGPGRTGHRLGRDRVDARRLGDVRRRRRTACRTCPISDRGRVAPSGSFRPARRRSSIPGTTSRSCATCSARSCRDRSAATSA